MNRFLRVYNTATGMNLNEEELEKLDKTKCIFCRKTKVVGYLHKVGGAMVHKDCLAKVFNPFFPSLDDPLAQKHIIDKYEKLSNLAPLLYRLLGMLVKKLTIEDIRKCMEGIDQPPREGEVYHTWRTVRLAYGKPMPAKDESQDWPEGLECQHCKRIIGMNYSCTGDDDHIICNQCSMSNFGTNIAGKAFLPVFAAFVEERLMLLGDEERIAFISKCAERFCQKCGSIYLPCYCTRDD